MEDIMYTILIADDEPIIRQGLKCIIDWEEKGFCIAGEASNGEEALHFILENTPDVVLLDIRMPKLSGLEVVKQARLLGYKGKVIILSGFSDFNYAKEAISHGVHYYLTKPIDEDELLQIVSDTAATLAEEKKKQQIAGNYIEKAKEIILKELLHGTFDPSSFNLDDFNMTASVYQVVIYEKYSHKEQDASYSFAELLRVTNNRNHSFETVCINEKQVIILKGEYAQTRFQDFLSRYTQERKPQKGSPLDSIFIAYGRSVNFLHDITLSFQDASHLLERRFFCARKQHTLGFEELQNLSCEEFKLTDAIRESYSNTLVNYIQAFNRNLVTETLAELQMKLYRSDNKPAQIKLFLTDLYLIMKEKIYHLYSKNHIPFLSNGTIIDAINEKHYLYEIIELFEEQCEMIIHSIGDTSRDNIIDSIVHYINHNYMENIKLEAIAPLFGYNSSYLGKIFNKKMGVSFNSYVDSVRIQESKKLLEHESLKVYEIAERVGYQNVDYFHMKFKKYMNMSPAEYRKKTKK